MRMSKFYLDKFISQSYSRRKEVNRLSEGSEPVIQCPCGRIIKDPSEYKLLYLKKEQFEIDIICPNDTCYLRELGFIKFRLEGDKIKIEKASFYPPFVTWNVTRLGKELATKLLKQHLKNIVEKQVDWEKIKEGAKKALEQESSGA